MKTCNSLNQNLPPFRNIFGLHRDSSRLLHTETAAFIKCATAMKEIWKVVPSAPFYAASNLGGLKVLPYYKRMNNGGIRKYEGVPKYAKPGKRFLVWYNRKKKNYKGHRLICEAFNGPPKAGQCCMHLDDDPSNNRPENLKWGTWKENLNTPKFISWCKSRVGDRSPHAIRKRKFAKQN